MMCSVKLNLVHGPLMMTDGRTLCILQILVYIRESVDSLCRDDADMPMPPYI